MRFRRTVGMGQRFFPAAKPDPAADLVARLGDRTDVYVGVACRARQAGGRSAVDHVWTLWADCDSKAAAVRLAAHEPAPSIVIASGSPHACHAYWLLSSPVAPDIAEATNRRLALALDADGQSCDAARILRPPGTTNFKHDPPRPVAVERMGFTRRPLEEIAVGLPDPPSAPEPASRRAAARRRHSADPLLAIEPTIYVRALLRVEIGRSRKVTCPFHPDEAPSLHVYGTGAGGWYCFACGRGTSIYDLAGPLWGLGTRGRDFLELRRRLTELFLPG